MMRMLTALLIVALSCGAANADHLEDLRAWRESGLPAAAVWNFDGFPLPWHVQQVRAGHRLIPSLAMNRIDRPGLVEKMQTNAAMREALEYIASERLPFTVRGDFSNWGSTFDERPEGIFAEVPADDPHEFARTEDGFRATNRIDVFAPAANWRERGMYIASRVTVTELRRRLPDPPFVVMLDNGEAPLTMLLWEKFQSIRGTHNRQWLPIAEIEKISVRMARRVEAMGGVTTSPYDLVPEFYRLQMAQHHAWRDGFASVVTEWPLITTAYKAGPEPRLTPAAVEQVGPAPVVMRYDGPSRGMYIRPSNVNLFADSHLDGDLPAIVKRYDSKLADLIVSLGEDPAQSIDVATWRAYVTWQLWRARTPGVPLLLHHFDNAGDKPTDPLGSATREDYVRAGMLAVDQICDSPVLRDFWQRGETIPSVYPAGPVKHHRYAAVRLDGRCLVYLFGAGATLDLPGFGAVVIPGSGYWVVKPAVGYVVENLK